MTTQLTTFDDKQYSYHEAIELAKEREESIIVRVSPDDYAGPAEYAVFEYAVREVPGWEDEFETNVILSELELNSIARISDSEDYFNDDRVEDIVSLARENDDKDLIDLLEDFGIEYDSFHWGNDQHSYYNFDADEFVQKANAQ